MDTLSKKSSPGALFIVTGEKGAGKTTFCGHLIERANAAGWQVGGILSAAVFENGQKTGIDTQDLCSGQRRHLATLRQRGQPALGPLTRRWNFDANVVAWANTVLQVATPCDLLVVDELGPLEFERGEGWSAGLTAVDSGAYRVGVVVIRPDLLAEAQRRWPAAGVIDITTNEHARTLVDTLARQLFSD